MKFAKLLFFFLFLPFVFYAQRTTLTGLWTGTMTNDSTAIRHDQSVEIALSQYKQKVTGYSRVTFIINDTLYNIIKRVKGTISGNVCEVMDDEIITHNFPVKPEKKVKLIYTFLFNPLDSSWRMDGKWKTTKTKEFYSISGKTELKEETDYNKSKLFPHLEELSLADDVPFYKEAKEQTRQSLAQTKNALPVVDKKQPLVLENKKDIAIKKEESRSESIADNKTIEKKEQIKDTESVKSKPPSIANDEEKKPVTTEQAISTKTVNADTILITKADIKKQKADSIIAKPGQVKSEQIATNKPVEEKKIEIKTTIPPPKSTNTDSSKTISKPVKTEIAQEKKTEPQKPVAVNTTKPAPVNDKPLAVTKPSEEKKQPVADEKKTEIAAVQKVIEKEKPVFPVAAISVNERKTISSQTVTFKSDSLMLSLYDNGEIDGDTVSVLLNGEIILAKQGLKAAAIRKTIYIEPGSDELILLLYAENLGKYPPNTGLLIVHDGEDVYQLRFSADLQQNAAIIFKRKK